ncbi:MAG: hypothetical protein B7Z74_03945 [Deltaproteobacteria bacterium 21-66-5]|nr:MAG: hypothetical protein B7Z74_03945 [Deltaproteobacteria bacterium 21-66-5]
MPLGARQLELRVDLRPDAAWQLLTEWPKHLVLGSAVSVHQHHKFVRRGSYSFKPGSLQKLFSHFHIEGLASRRDTYLDDGNVFFLQMGNEVRKRAPLGLARSNDDDNLGHIA